MTIYYYDDKEFNDIDVFRIYLLKKYLTKHYGETSAKKLIVAYQNDLLSLSKELGLKDIAFFAEYFLTNKFVASSENVLKPLGKVHYEIFENLNRLLIDDLYDNQEFILPRGIGKSTIINSLTATWGAVYKNSIFTVVLGKTDKLMAEFIDEVRMNLADEFLIECFGNLIPKDRNLTNNSCELELSNGAKVQGVTWGGSIRGIKYKGYRPSLIITDDILKDDDVRSDNMMQRSIDKYYNEVLPAGTEARYIKGKKSGMSTKFIVIGTPLAQGDFINVIKKDSKFKVLHKSVCNFDVDAFFNTDIWQNYKKLLLDPKDNDRINTAKNYYLQNKAKMRFDTIWSNYPQLKMANKYFTERLSFMQEYQCDCENVGEVWIKYMAKMSSKEIEDREFEKTILTIDQSASNSNKSDYTAMTVLSKSNGFYFVREGQLYKFDSKTEFDKYIDTVIFMLKKWKQITHVFLEKNVYKGVDATRIEEKILEDTDLINRGITVETRYNTKNKDQRLSTITDKINSGTIIFNESDIEYNKQIFDFRGQKYSIHDDAIDSLEMAVNEIDEVELMPYLQWTEY